jgi:VanZ family protein
MKAALRVLCLVMLVALLAAGLWPFDFSPKNNAVWMAGAQGLSFSPYGIAVARQPVALPAPAPQPSAVTVELYLQPSRYYFTDYAEIFSLYRPGQSDWFTIAKDGPRLYLDGRYDTGEKPSGVQRLRAFDVFRRDQTDLLTVVAGPAGTYVYRDGLLLHSFPEAKPFPQTLAGEPVLGNSPNGHAAWTGNVFGLAIYSRALSPAEVEQDNLAWTSRSLQSLGAQPGIVALFPFQEGSGATIHDLISGGPSLQIPAGLKPPHHAYLELPSRRSFHRIRDVVQNIVGLMPFGFLVAGCIQYGKQSSLSRAVVLAMLAGLALSLTIEILQAYLPSRDSSLTDVINNTLGSGLGALFWPLGMRVLKAWEKATA